MSSERESKEVKKRIAAKTLKNQMKYFALRYKFEELEQLIKEIKYEEF